MARIAIVGAGISGLACAEWLGAHDVRVLEATDRAGGKVRTEELEGFVLNLAANGFLDNEPSLESLVEEVGLGEDRIRARAGDRFVFLGGKMQAMPMGPGAFLRSPLLPWTARVRALCEGWVGPGPGEESVYDFVARRLGVKVAERFAAVLVAGVFAGDPRQLSMQAAFPQITGLVEAHGSLISGVKAQRSARGDRPPPGLTSFRQGVGALSERLAERLGDRLQTESPCEQLAHKRGTWTLRCPGGSVEADAVILACPAPVTAGLLTRYHPEIAGEIRGIPYASATVVSTAFRDAEGPEGFGCLVPPEAGLGIMGTLFSSWVFPSHAPEGSFLLRTMVGGALDPEADALSDEALIQRVTRANQQLLGPLPAPSLVHVARHSQGIPQPGLGHKARVARVRAGLASIPGLFLAGNYIGGVGVKDCVRESSAVAEAVGEFLAG